MQSLCDVPTRWVVSASQDSGIRWIRPVVTGDLVPSVAIRDSRVGRARTEYVTPFVASAFLLFLLGAATAYFTLPHALGFLKSVGGPNLQAIYDPIPYLGLILLMMALFGLTFQFPVVLVSLELARVVTPARLLHAWRWAIISIVVVSAVVTPSSDPFSMFALALPLMFFYFVSIAIGKLLGR